MAARKKKTASKKPAARKAAKKRAAAKKLPARKAAKPPARKAATRKKAPKAAGKKVAARKAAKLATRRPAPKGKVTKRKVARKVAPARLPMAPPAVTALDERIALVRANLRELVEMAAGSAGAASEELMSQRITEQEEKLRELTQQRDEAAKQG